MNTVFKCMFGSTIYGTNLPTSDFDYKGIYVPSSTELLLQRAIDSTNEGTKTNDSEKNRAGDIDFESFSVQKFLELACQGQTVALDMLFVPKEFIFESGPIWSDIQKNKNKLIHKGTSAFVGYTKAQASKYGIKGFRVAALRDTLEALSKYTTNANVPLFAIEPQLREFVAKLNSPYVQFVEGIGSQNLPQMFLEVCSRKIPIHAKIDYTQNVLSTIYQNYGTRARLAEKNEGIDWRALMHAVRVAHEAVELLTYHSITFPRPEKELLLKIRKAEMPYQEVAQIIEEGLLKVEEAKEKSTLPDSPDREWVDDFVLNVHHEETKNHFLNETKKLVEEFFNEEPYKATLWMATPNPSLGGLRPSEFREDKRLYKMVKSMLRGEGC